MLPFSRLAATETINEAGASICKRNAHADTELRILRLHKHNPSARLAAQQTFQDVNPCATFPSRPGFPGFMFGRPGPQLDTLPNGTSKSAQPWSSRASPDKRDQQDPLSFEGQTTLPRHTHTNLVEVPRPRCLFTSTIACAGVGACEGVL